MQLRTQYQRTNIGARSTLSRNLAACLIIATGQQSVNDCLCPSLSPHLILGNAKVDQVLAMPKEIHSDDCTGERKQHVIERGICYKTTGGRSYRIDSLPSDGEVITYVDGECREDPFACNWGISNPGGCFTTDDFESLVVVTRELPA